ncbi:MAG: hypothetical protein EOO09_01890 [Chitinophagaceae bacterium]|nr:MAG: hypothetical protein EOO09_01890 [Chitinophagaceae bacterium]
MDAAKIQLSEEEKGLISNGDWILTKNRVLAKVNGLLADLMARQQGWTATAGMHPGMAFPDAPPKISRGENYQGLPWMMLDYPRLFTPADTFAIRCFFWWGNFFSITLQLAGASQERYAARLSAAYEQFCDRHYLVAIAKDQWLHHDQPDNYIPVEGMTEDTFSAHLRTHGFAKLMTSVPLSKWDAVPDLLLSEYRFLLETVGG